VRTKTPCQRHLLFFSRIKRNFLAKREKKESPNGKKTKAKKIKLKN
jgi:hypothetical protein